MVAATHPPTPSHPAPTQPSPVVQPPTPPQEYSPARHSVSTHSSQSTPLHNHMTATPTPPDTPERLAMRSHTVDHDFRRDDQGSKVVMRSNSESRRRSESGECLFGGSFVCVYIPLFVKLDANVLLSIVPYICLCVSKGIYLYVALIRLFHLLSCVYIDAN